MHFSQYKFMCAQAMDEAAYRNAEGDKHVHKFYCLHCSCSLSFVI